MKKDASSLILATVLLLSCCVATLSYWIEPFGEMHLWPLYTMTFFAGFVFATFVLICFLKREFRFIPNLVISIFVFMFLLSNTMEMELERYTALALAFEYACIGMITFGATLSADRKIGKIPVRLPLAATALLVALLSFVYSLASAALGLKIVLFILYGLLIVGILLAAAYAAFKEKNAELYANPVIACVLLLSYVYFRSPYVNTFSPDYVLCTCMLVVTLIVGVKELVLLERRNAYLTANMQAEIDRQTEELRTVSDENQQIVYDLSHNLKKSVIGLRRFTKIAQDREKDEEQLQILHIVYDKALRLEKDLDELAEHARHHHTPKAMEAFFLDEVLNEVQNALISDCEANGILLTVRSPKCKLFGNRKELINALISLLVTSISHEGCQNVTLSAVAELAHCTITVTDDSGRYNSDDEGAWKACKAVAESMQGEASHEKRHEEYAAYITLPTV